MGIGLIGCGQIARQRYVPMLKRRPDVEVVAVCTNHTETAQQAASRLGSGVSWTTDFEELVLNPRVNAVIITTPHKLHARQAAVALEAGKHALVEKPMATNWEDAQRLVKTARQSQATVMALPHEHVAQLRAMMSCLDPNILGRIVGISADFSGPGAPPGRSWKYSLDQSGGGIIVAHAVYALDLVASVMGPAKKVTAFANTLIAERVAPDGETVRSDIEDNAVILLQYDTGQHVIVRSCWGYPRKQRVLTVQGSQRSLIMAPGGIYVTPPLRDTSSSAGFVDSVFFPSQKIQRVEVLREKETIVDHFIRCILSGETPEANIDRAAHVTEQMMKAYESIRTGTAMCLTTSFAPRTALDRRLFHG